VGGVGGVFCVPLVGEGVGIPVLRGGMAQIYVPGGWGCTRSSGARPVGQCLGRGINRKWFGKRGKAFSLISVGSGGAGCQVVVCSTEIEARWESMSRCQTPGGGQCVYGGELECEVGLPY